MLKQTKRVAVLMVGVIFVLFGILGLFLPFLQGILFWIIGLLLPSAYSPTLREWMQTHTRKYPKVHYWVLRAEAWVERILGKPE